MFDRRDGEHFHIDRPQTLQAQQGAGAEREIQVTIGDEWSAVIDRHIDRPVVFRIGDTDQRADRERQREALVGELARARAELGRLLSLGPDGERIRSEAMEGRKVLFPPEPLTLERWTGTGYLVWDPATWYGASRTAGHVASTRTPGGMRR